MRSKAFRLLRSRLLIGLRSRLLIGLRSRLGLSGLGGLRKIVIILVFVSSQSNFLGIYFFIVSIDFFVFLSFGSLFSSLFSLLFVSCNLFLLHQDPRFDEEIGIGIHVDAAQTIVAVGIKLIEGWKLLDFLIDIVDRLFVGEFGEKIAFFSQFRFILDSRGGYEIVSLLFFFFEFRKKNLLRKRYCMIHLYDLFVLICSDLNKGDVFLSQKVYKK